MVHIIRVKKSMYLLIHSKIVSRGRSQMLFDVVTPLRMDCSLSMQNKFVTIFKEEATSALTGFHAVLQVELEFGNVVFFEERKNPRGKARTNN